MPTFTLTPASYTFKPFPPGVQPAPTTTVSVGLEDVVFPPDNKIQIPVTLAITPISSMEFRGHPYTPGVFAATLQQSYLTRHGLGPPVPIVSTTGSPVSGTIILTEDLPGPFSISVTFTPPATPLPGLFEASLVLSGWGGTTNMVRAATTAQITATPTLVGADDVFAPVVNPTTSTLPPVVLWSPSKLITFQATMRSSISMSCPYP